MDLDDDVVQRRRTASRILIRIKKLVRLDLGDLHGRFSTHCYRSTWLVALGRVERWLSHHFAPSGPPTDFNEVVTCRLSNWIRFHSVPRANMPCVCASSSTKASSAPSSDGTPGQTSLEIQIDDFFLLHDKLIKSTVL